jgi:hypothetical protein
MNLKKNLQALLPAIAILFTVGGLITLIPHAGASEASILGYKALCPLAPISTVLTLYVGLTAGSYLVCRR